MCIKTNFMLSGNERFCGKSATDHRIKLLLTYLAYIYLNPKTTNE
jgi:hypothetical protein